MPRTIIEEGSGPAYVESSGPGLGVVLGVLLAVAAIALVILFMVGALGSSNSPAHRNTPFTGGGGGGASAPAQPSGQPSAQSNPTP